MKSKFLALGALGAFALVASPAFAQVPTLSSPGRSVAPVKANQGNSNSNGGVADVLWDQSDYDPAANAFVDQDFTDFPSVTSFLVQDIDTGGASWNVSKVSTYFTNQNGGWSNLITTCDVQVYPKTGSLPDNSNVPPQATAPCTLTLTTNVDGWICAADTTGIAGLQGVSGQFWCGVTPQAAFGTYGQEWHFETLSAAQGDHTAFINPGGGFGVGTTWQDVTAIAGGIFTTADCAILLEGTGGGGGGYTCNVTGNCPGTVTVAWSGAQPNKQQAIVFGQNQGNTVIPNGKPCAGTTLGIAGGVMQVGNFIGTGNGSGQVNGNAGNSACGHYLQLVTGGSCATSSVAQIP